MALTILQENFVRAYLADPKHRVRDAVIRAGFSEKRASITGSELMKNSEVQLAIHEKQIAALEAAQVDTTYVIMGIRDTVERCRSLGKAFNPNAAFKGFELLGRYLKLWTDKVELNDVGDLADRIRAEWKEDETKITAVAVVDDNAEKPAQEEAAAEPKVN